MSEKFSDLVDPAIKYGGGPDVIRSRLTETSTLISNTEVLEKKLAADEAWLAEKREVAKTVREQARSTLVQIADRLLTAEQLAAKESLEQNQKNITALELEIAAWQERVSTGKEAVGEVTRRVGRMLQEMITGLPTRKGEKGAVLD